MSHPQSRLRAPPNCMMWGCLRYLNSEQLICANCCEWVAPHAGHTKENEEVGLDLQKSANAAGALSAPGGGGLLGAQQRLWQPRIRHIADAP